MGARRRLKNVFVALAAAAAIATTAHAEPLPLPKPPGPGGSCPHGYLSSGSFYVPSQGAQDAIASKGECPARLRLNSGAAFVPDIP